MNTQKHIMIDIETLGLKPGAVIMSIGAVLFDRHGLCKGEYYNELQIDWQLRAGLAIETETLQWWTKQKTEIPIHGIVHPKLALIELSNWIEKNAVVGIWSNSPSFDIEMLKILNEKAQALIEPRLFDYKLQRDFRTLRAVVRNYAQIALDTTDEVRAHHALDDARWQARVVSKCLPTI